MQEPPVGEAQEEAGPAASLPLTASAGAPQCQICQISLATARTFFKRYRICEEHAAQKELLVEGLPQRFCQQCGRFHPLHLFDTDQRSCREELARHAARRRELRRRKKGLAPSGAGVSRGASGEMDALLAGGSSGGGGLLHRALSLPQPGGALQRQHHARRDGPYRRVMMTGRQGVGPPATASPWAAAAAPSGSPAGSPHQGGQAELPQAQPALQQWQQMPLQQSAPVPASSPWGNASAQLADAHALLGAWSSLNPQQPTASSDMFSSSTAAHLAELPGLAALSAALSAQPGAAAALQASFGLGHGLSLSLAPGHGHSDAASGSGSGSGLPPAPDMQPRSTRVAELLHSLLNPGQRLPTIQSLPVPELRQQQPQQRQLLSMPLPGPREQQQQHVGGTPPSGPICQVCSAPLADLLPFYKRYRVCAEHMAAREVLRDGVPHRFCQQCGRFHSVDCFDGTQRTCRDELAWRRYRRSHGSKDREAVRAEGKHHRHKHSRHMQNAEQGLTPILGGTDAQQPAEPQQEQQPPQQQEQQQEQQVPAAAAAADAAAAAPAAQPATDATVAPLAAQPAADVAAAPPATQEQVEQAAQAEGVQPQKRPLPEPAQAADPGAAPVKLEHQPEEKRLRLHSPPSQPAEQAIAPAAMAEPPAAQVQLPPPAARAPPQPAAPRSHNTSAGTPKRAPPRLQQQPPSWGAFPAQLAAPAASQPQLPVAPGGGFLQQSTPPLVQSAPTHGGVPPELLAALMSQLAPQAAQPAAHQPSPLLALLQGQAQAGPDVPSVFASAVQQMEAQQAAQQAAAAQQRDALMLNQLSALMVQQLAPPQQVPPQQSALLQLALQLLAQPTPQQQPQAMPQPQAAQATLLQQALQLLPRQAPQQPQNTGGLLSALQLAQLPPEQQMLLLGLSQQLGQPGQGGPVPGSRFPGFM